MCAVGTLTCLVAFFGGDRASSIRSSFFFLRRSSSRPEEKSCFVCFIFGTCSSDSKPAICSRVYLGRPLCCLTANRTKHKPQCPRYNSGALFHFLITFSLFHFYRKVRLRSIFTRSSLSAISALARRPSLSVMCTISFPCTTSPPYAPFHFSKHKADSFFVCDLDWCGLCPEGAPVGSGYCCPPSAVGYCRYVERNAAFEVLYLLWHEVIACPPCVSFFGLLAIVSIFMV